MKQLIGMLLVLLIFTGCAAQGGNAGAAPGANTGTAPGADTGAAPGPDAGGETWGFYVGSLYGIRYELGDLEDVFTVTPTEARDSSLVNIRTQVLIDADIHLYLDDGREISKSHFDSDYWQYSFTMPDRDVVIRAEPYTKAEIWGFAGSDMAFIRGVQYVRTDSFSESGVDPQYFWLSSAEELRSYIAETGPGLTKVQGRYDDAFFAENDLLVVIKTEGSGSNRHEVTGVKVSPSQTEGKQYLLRPEIKRLVPDCGTCDIAGWHILIEIAKDHGAAVSELEAPVFTTVQLAG